MVVFPADVGIKEIGSAEVVPMEILITQLSLRDPEIPLGAWHAAADRIRDPFIHRRHRKEPVEAEALAAEVAPGVLVNVECMEGAVQAGLEVAQQGVDPTELRQVVWVLPPVTIALWWQPAVLTARKQARASESTWQPGARWSLDQSAIVSELKPLTSVILA